MVVKERLVCCTIFIFSNFMDLVLWDIIVHIIIDNNYYYKLRINYNNDITKIYTEDYYLFYLLFDNPITIQMYFSNILTASSTVLILSTSS